MQKPSEGKVDAKFAQLVDDLIEGLIYNRDDEYPLRSRRKILGLADVAKGFKPNVPTTVYQVTGDDTSGIVGLLYPNGEFLPTPAPRRKATYWEHEETLSYKTIEGHDGKPRVVGDSWRTDEVLWDGSVAGSVNVLGEDGDHEGPINVREWDATLHEGDWITTGELWRALMRGTSMHGGRVPGRVHSTIVNDSGTNIDLAA